MIWKLSMMRTWVLLTLLIGNTARAAEVTVERESLPGPDRIRAETSVRAGTDRILAALETPCAVQSWLPGADELEVLERDASRTRVRMYTRFPWPWRDRVAHLLFVRHEEPERIRITMKAQPWQAHVDAVVVTQSTARWTLIPEGKTTRLRYQQRFNPGGTVPQWLADSLSESRVADALENLSALVENRRTLADCDWADAPTGRERTQSPGMP